MKLISKNSILILSTLVLQIGFLGVGCSSSSTEGDADDLQETTEVTEDTASTDAAPPADGQGEAVTPGGEAGSSGTATASTYTPAAAVEIPSAPVEKEGTVLNGYTFIRAGETSWDALSNKIFGNTDQAENLKKWNGGKSLRPGQMVYYPSATRAGDPALKSHYEETGTALEPYTVKKGDSLSTIAKSHFGHTGTWKEISAVNPDLKAPDQLVVGSTIQLPPGGQKVASSEVGASPEVASQTPTETPPSSAEQSDSAQVAETAAVETAQPTRNVAAESARAPVTQTAPPVAEKREPSSFGENASDTPENVGMVAKVRGIFAGPRGLMVGGGIALGLAGLGLFMRARARRIA